MVIPVMLLPAERIHFRQVSRSCFQDFRQRKFQKPVPFFHLKNSSCIRLLCTDQYLLIKRTFVVVAGWAKKGFLWLRHFGYGYQHGAVQFGNELIFICHWCSPPKVDWNKKRMLFCIRWNVLYEILIAATVFLLTVYNRIFNYSG